MSLPNTPDLVKLIPNGMENRRQKSRATVSASAHLRKGCAIVRTMLVCALDAATAQAGTTTGMDADAMDGIVRAQAARGFS